MKLVLSFSLSVCVFLAQAQKFSDVYKPGDRLYICSREGLSLRQSADPKAKAIKVLPYATALTVLIDSNPRVPFVSTGVPGNWTRVEAAGSTGYVFDGFLSRFTPMALAPNDSFERNWNDLRNFLKAQFKLDSQTPTDNGLKMLFTNGAIYSDETSKAGDGGAGGSSAINTEIPASVITFQEVYLLARMLYPGFFANNQCEFKVDKMECKFEFDEGGRNLAIYKDEKGTAYRIAWRSIY